jgi:CheY-like chemotaxis protein/nitrogen-specific signal transduction histidine kinase
MAQAKSRTKPAKRATQRRALPGRRRGAGPTPTTLAAFAHDMRTALTGILALGDLLASSNLGERERRWASGIKAGAEHLAALTTLLLDAAKVDAGTLTLEQQVFRPRRLIEAVADALAARAETKGVRAEVTVAEHLPELLIGDPVRLRAAIENLIDNAVKFTERGTVRMAVATAPAGRGLVQLAVTVTDSGIGISEAELKRLFRPFVQASPAIARRYGGSGLGLAIVKVLARQMGGDLSVTSTPGQGSAFRFAVVLRRAAAEPARGGAVPAGAPARRLAVLCVEDNPYGRVILNTILSELGHRADFAASGEEALDAVMRGYDVVLMDVALPGIDGLEATRRIRALEGAPARTPIIGVSGRSDAADEAAARAAGMDGYLRKPVSPRGLSEAIAALLSPVNAE